MMCLLGITAETEGGRAGLKTSWPRFCWHQKNGMVIERTSSSFWKGDPLISPILRSLKTLQGLFTGPNEVILKNLLVEFFIENRNCSNPSSENNADLFDCIYQYIDLVKATRKRKRAEKKHGVHIFHRKKKNVVGKKLPVEKQTQSKKWLTFWLQANGWPWCVTPRWLL